MATFSEKQQEWKEAVDATRQAKERLEELKARLALVEHEMKAQEQIVERLKKEEIQKKKEMIAVGNPKSTDMSKERQFRKFENRILGLSEE